MKYLSIYFIGRKQGIGLRRYRLSHLENRRKYEYEGFQDAYKSIRQVRLIQNADVVWVRVRPEHTTDYERIIIEKRLKTIRGKVPIINDINILKSTAAWLWCTIENNKRDSLKSHLYKLWGF